MNIYTNTPVINDRNKLTIKVAKFWNQVSEGVDKVWGPHIHHGFYEANKNLTPLQAQENLMQRLAAMMNLPSHARVIDAGCGMGGSSIYLTKKFQCALVGITLSSKQAAIAAERARAEQLDITFKVEDAINLASFTDNSIDLVWSLESCEQFYDKELFLKNAYRVLKPGGQLMLATWCSDKDNYADQEAKDYKKLCYAFDVPYMPTIAYYQKILIENGFKIKETHDWSEAVQKTWHVAISLVNAFDFWKLFKMAGFRGLLFCHQLKLMQKAFDQKKIRYGVFLVEK